MLYNLLQVLPLCLCLAYLTRAAPSQSESRQTIVLYDRVNFTGAVTTYSDSFSVCKDTGLSLASSANLTIGTCICLCPNVCSSDSTADCTELTSSQRTVNLFGAVLNDKLRSIRKCSKTLTVRAQEMRDDYVLQNDF